MLLSIEGTPPSLAAIPAGCAFHPRCSFATEACQLERPPLVAIGEGRLVACFHHEQVAAVGSPVA